MTALTPAAVGAVFFDFAGTLFSDRDLRGVHLHQLRFVALAAGVEGSDDELRTAYRRGLRVAFRAVASQPAYSHRALFGSAFAAMANVLGAQIDEDTAQEAVDRQYRATIDAVVLRSDCLDTLDALSGASVHVQIVSNIDDEQFEPMLERLGLNEVIDAATSSEQARSCKPDPRIYRMALEKASCDPSQVMFVGDNLRHDVEGPAAVGMRTAWLAPHAKANAGGSRPNEVIHQLSDVIGLVVR